MTRAVDLTRQRFGRLLVVSRGGTNKHRQPIWLCRCDCGAERIVVGHSLRSGATQSCGCLQRERASVCNRRHGELGSAEYISWRGMIHRCTNSKATDYSLYGGRGITVCARWRRFENFLADMGRRPSPQHSLDRVNNARGYSKANCRWATPKEQGRNKRNNITLRYKGETLCLGGWAERTGISYNRLYKRIRRGWSLGKALGVR